MPLLFILGTFVTGVFVARSAHAALRQEELHQELKKHVEHVVKSELSKIQKV